MKISHLCRESFESCVRACVCVRVCHDVASQEFRFVFHAANMYRLQEIQSPFFPTTHNHQGLELLHAEDVAAASTLSLSDHRRRSPRKSLPSVGPAPLISISTDDG